MHRTGLIYLLILFAMSFDMFSQWSNIGIQSNRLFMTENGVGFKATGNYFSPSSGSSYQIKKTKNDWQNELTLFNNGGGPGCCTVSGLLFVDTSIGFYSLNNAGVTYFYKTTDNGNTWKYFSNPVSIDLKGIYFVNDTLGYVSGNSYDKNNGQVYQISTSGKKIIGDFDSLAVNKVIFFNSNNTGYIAAKDSNNYYHLLKKVSTASPWTIIFTDTADRILSCYFPSDSIGYIGTTNGEIYKTINFGNNWTQLNSPTFNNINCINFNSDNSGYIACNNGEFYKTTDGGSTWNIENLKTSNHLTSIQVLDDSIIYVIDNQNNLYKNKPLLILDTLFYSNNEDFFVFPNPFSNEINIILKENEYINKLKVFNSLGQLIVSEKKDKINTLNLSSGIYYVLIETNQRKGKQKIIK